MLPPAPGLFCTTMVLPMFSLSLVAIMRAAASAAPPGTKPTTRLMGFSGGKVWAWAGAVREIRLAESAATQESRRKFMMLLVKTVGYRYGYGYFVAVTA